MKAVILAGGKGTRLRPVTGGLPKPMAPLLGRPVMAHIIELLRRNGITDICASLGYCPEPIGDYFGDGSAFGVHLRCHIERAPLGTAGGVRACMVGEQEAFLVISGDAVCDFDLAALIRRHQQDAPAVTIALHPQADPLRYGTVLTDGDGRVLQLLEKPPWEKVVTDLVNTGIYVVSPQAMAQVPPDVPFDFARDLFPRLLAQGETLLGVQMAGYWCDIGTPLAYYQCCVDALRGTLRLHSGWERTPEPEVRHKTRLSVACGDRARTMRRLSEALMGAGTSFDDGVRITREHCSMHVYPQAERSAICIECACSDAEFAETLALTVEELVKCVR